MKLTVNFESPTEPKIFAEVLNELAKVAEYTGNSKLEQEFYVEVFTDLSIDAHEMIAKLDIL